MPTTYDELPNRVQEAARDPDDWEMGDPTAIQEATCESCGDGLFWVELPDDEGESCFICGQHTGPQESHGEPVNDWGEPTHAEYIDGDLYAVADPTDERDGGGILCGGCYENFDYHPDGTVSVVGSDGTTASVTHMGGIMQLGYDTEMTDEMREIVEAIVAGTTTVSIDAWRSSRRSPDEAADLTRVSSGWHSSMERSEQSDRINAITNGEMHHDRYFDLVADGDEMVDVIMDPDKTAAEEFETVESDGPGWDFPVAVNITTTSNVCSTGLAVYAPESDADAVREFLEDATAQPVYAGL